jgi:type IV pilus assembly protein PilV
MRNSNKHNQSGMTLIEVLISVLILAIGLLGAAALQLKALKYTDGSALSSQASFIAYDLMDRIRANVDGNASSRSSTTTGPAVLATYALAATAATPTANLNLARDQDLADFRANIVAFGGSTATGAVDVSAGPQVTITITWSDARAAASAAEVQTFTLTSRVGANAVSNL